MNIVKPNHVKNKQYYLIGVILIILNYFRHTLFGYKTPRTFSNEEIERSIEYDFNVVNGWLQYLPNDVDYKYFLEHKIILELGPGPDLGVGLILLAMGIKKYIALDVNELAMQVPDSFYDTLFIRIKKRFNKCDVDYLKRQLKFCLNNEESNLNYLVDKDFNISKIKLKVDLVLSQAVFEHFSNVEETIRNLSKIVNSGGLLVAEVDLKTHTRWIRDKDPLNIYRYSPFFWNLMKFKGSPNRVRSFEYEKILEKNGWTNIKVIPIKVLDKVNLKKVMPTLNRKYRYQKESEMGLLSFILIAQKI